MQRERERERERESQDGDGECMLSCFIGQRPINGQIDRQIDRRIDRQIDRQTNKYIDSIYLCLWKYLKHCPNQSIEMQCPVHLKDHVHLTTSKIIP